MFTDSSRSVLTACWIIVASAVMNGCMLPMPAGMAAPSAPLSSQSYMPVDFKKWNSGMYADEFIGKPVLVEGYFQKNPMAGSYQGSDIIFSVLEKSSSQMVRLQQRWAAGDRTESVTDMLSQITVTAPLAMRDVIYPIRDEQRVRVYGVVVNPYATSVFTGRVVMSALTVRADRVEIAR